MGSTFSERIKEIRTSQKLTQKQLAEKAQVSIAAYSSYEQGVKNPPLDSALRLAEALNVSLDWLCGKDSNAGNAAPKSRGDVIRMLSMIVDANAVAEISTEKKPANEIEHLVRIEGPDMFAYWLPEGCEDEDGNRFEYIRSAVLKFHSTLYGWFFDEWGKLLRLFEDGVISRDVYQIWLERKIDEFSKDPLKARRNE